MGARSRIITTYEPDSRKKFHWNPTVSMRIPLMAAPASRMGVTAMALRARAFAKSYRWTVLATSACRVGWMKAKARPETSMYP